MDQNNVNEAVLPLEKFIAYRLNQAAEKVSQKFALEYKKRYGMTRPEWRTLATIGQFGNITAKQICQHSSMHKTKVSRAIFTLEQRRWLKRTVDQNDRRVEHLELTLQGQKAYLELSDVARNFQDQIYAALGPANTAALETSLDAIETLIDTQ
ncbi:MarR family winged helix-turn-helix transcriptional regulator [Maritalea mediterranea]|uniref:MarR family winged helix-turn-helix transcriptional regulator n=1 Tax=Maritalea mediterranea TaxID=2909667 RepID=A0ABS9EDN0_9HYPH|nr:MarR family winged helix-turn-helix transcriptional regulator [Maritalea mediterranea]MCF4099541.1 MarR family winged helix-turn-helix transcriptional regulator [Maritalea mediterranea]